ncbi:hypothetical protein LPJ78_003967 [Coemansia sp. RSA 989]|nr:IGR protein motif-domain-containing protein [Coemansia mojavensis]KAJ1741971.1 hypothetical protein LPJ68_002338 [Coemansia sp. RSA 1086]KAJ1749966.1 hypothetical protein LPJ79_003286 [Coemansia sp. RSA 1821]KAJ1863580.1 hypothetical protein LPJ78_003967 [Coemansia sp. RSA 989]KAJ2630033.1 hypothetical protein H4R22_002951 [Coemansia sp. RSA 1290]
MLARLGLKPVVCSAFVRAASTDATALSKAVTNAALYSKSLNKPQVPKPRGKFNSPQVFLQTIGRGCEKFASKFESWEELFTADSLKMKSELGIGPKQRKWILRWTNHFRLGIDPYFIPTSKKHEMTRAARLARSKRRRKN